MVSAIAVFGWLNYSGNRDHAIETWRRTLDHEAKIVALKPQAAARDVLVLFPADTQTVQKFTRSASDEARARNEHDFRALVKGKPGYVQVRLTSLAGDYPKLARVDQKDDLSFTVPTDNLPNQSDRDYVLESKSLEAENVYLSNINLNRDFDRITIPHTPMMRVVAPVYAGGAAPAALTVVNVDMRTFFEQLERQKASDIRLYVANSDGSYLLHSRSDALHGSDLGHAWNFANHSAQDRNEFSQDFVSSQTERGLLSGLPRKVYIRTGCLPSLVLDGLRTARNRALLASAITAIIGASLLALFVRWLTTRLRRTTHALAAYDPGETSSPLPETPHDELGVLAAGFNQMTTNSLLKCPGFDGRRERRRQ
jgi:HAMP domain-containing protein